MGEKISFEEQQLAFKQMLKKCKITKFFDVNFKILHRILAIPALIVKIQGSNGLCSCQWCSEVANIDHILVHCVETNCIYSMLENVLDLSFLKWERILGTYSNRNPVLWVVNFAIYKAHIQWCEGVAMDLLDVVHGECDKYSSIFPILSNLRL